MCCWILVGVEPRVYKGTTQKYLNEAQALCVFVQGLPFGANWLLCIGAHVCLKL